MTFSHRLTEPPSTSTHSHTGQPTVWVYAWLRRQHPPLLVTEPQRRPIGSRDEKRAPITAARRSFVTTLRMIPKRHVLLLPSFVWTSFGLASDVNYGASGTVCAKDLPPGSGVCSDVCTAAPRCSVTPKVQWNNKSPRCSRCALMFLLKPFDLRTILSFLLDHAQLRLNLCQLFSPSMLLAASPCDPFLCGNSFAVENLPTPPFAASCQSTRLSLSR